MYTSQHLVEDLKIGRCMHLVGGVGKDTRDKDGKETFIVMDIGSNIHGDYPDWYYTWHEKRGALKVHFLLLKHTKDICLILTKKPNGLKQIFHHMPYPY